jgi:hypothetical protein
MMEMDPLPGPLPSRYNSMQMPEKPAEMPDIAPNPRRRALAWRIYTFNLSQTECFLKQRLISVRVATPLGIQA